MYVDVVLIWTLIEILMAVSFAVFALIAVKENIETGKPKKEQMDKNRREAFRRVMENSKES